MPDAPDPPYAAPAADPPPAAAADVAREPVPATPSIVEAPPLSTNPVEAIDAAAAAPAPPPEAPVSRAKEWGVAILLMLVFAMIGAAFLSVLRS